MINLNCPHCSPIDHFQAAIAEPQGKKYTGFIEVYGKLWRWPRSIKPKQADPSGQHKQDPEAQKLVTVVEHGKYALITLDENNFVPAWRGFKVEILGMDYGLALPRPPGPLFHDVTTYVTSTLGGGGPRERKIFNACRVTRNRSKVDVRIHWWPDHSSVVAALGEADQNKMVQWWPNHGRIVTIRGLSLGRINTQELDQVNRALTLLRFLETRGPKTVITEQALRKAILKLGERASQMAVANELSVTDRAIRQFRDRIGKGGLTWSQFRSLYTNRN